MYGSQDLQVGIHECRVMAEDDLYVATKQTTDFELHGMKRRARPQIGAPTRQNALDDNVHSLLGGVGRKPAFLPFDAT
jgi:hypothetical protein